MKTGRNDPCPCGSGKKHKHGCLRAESGLDAPPDELLRRRISAATEGLPAQMLGFALEHVGPSVIDEAWADFTAEDDAFDPQTRHLPVFAPWSLYHWSPDPASTEFPDMAARGATVALEFLARRRRHLDPLAVRYLEACMASTFSFHEIVRAEPGRGMLLRDLLRGEETFVVEIMGSRSARVGDILFARIVVLDGLAQLDGCSSFALEPGDRLPIIELRKRMHLRNERIDATAFGEWMLDVVALYFDLAEARLNPRPPTLQNTDGEPLEPRTLRFDLADPGAAATAFAAASLSDGESIVADDVRHDAAGRLTGGEWTWRREGNALHASWDNTSLGRLVLKGNTLEVSVNSAGRADRAQALIERVLGANGSYRATKIESLEAMLAEAKSRPQSPGDSEHERLMQLPEVREQLQAMVLKHYASWVDTAIPALGGKSPREAVRDADGREAVAALVAQIERHGARQSPPLDAAVPAMLRRELGLTP